MKLYTINATWVRPNVTTLRVPYSHTVSNVLGDYGIDGFTLYEVDGYWMGVNEVSYKIEVALTDEQAKSILEVCEKLRALYDQDAVMLTYPDNSVEFIERGE